MMRSEHESTGSDVPRGGTLHRAATFRWGVLAVIVATIIVFGNTFLNQWTYDDTVIVVNNPAAHSLRGFIQNLGAGRPLRYLTHIPEYALFGLHPAGYHIQQLLWHAGNGILLLLIFQAVGLELPFALAGTFLFLLHPVQTATVASVGNRKELLALFFVLLSVLSYIRGVAAEGRRRVWWVMLALASYGVSLLANVTAVTLPLAIGLYDALFVPKERRIILRSIPLFFVVFVAASTAFLYHYRSIFSIEERLTIYSQNSFFASLAYYPLFWGAVKAFGFYLGKIAYPLHLAPEYSLRFSTDLIPVAAVPGLLLLGGAIVSLPILCRRAPRIAFGIGWFLIFYLPISGFIPAGYIVADRYMYLCLPGIGLVIGSLVQKWPRGLTVPCSALLLVLAVLTVRQNSYWRNSLVLWAHAAEVNPGSTGANLSAAASFLQAGDLPKAKFCAQRVLALNPSLIYADFLLGQIALREGDARSAVEHFERYVRIGQGGDPGGEMAYVLSILPALKKMDEGGAHGAAPPVP